MATLKCYLVLLAEWGVTQHGYRLLLFLCVYWYKPRYFTYKIFWFYNLPIFFHFNLGPPFSIDPRRPLHQRSEGAKVEIQRISIYPRGDHGQDGGQQAPGPRQARGEHGWQVRLQGVQ